MTYGQAQLHTYLLRVQDGEIDQYRGNGGVVRSKRPLTNIYHFHVQNLCLVQLALEEG